MRENMTNILFHTRYKYTKLAWLVYKNIFLIKKKKKPQSLGKIAHRTGIIKLRVFTKHMTQPIGNHFEQIFSHI